MSNSKSRESEEPARLIAQLRGALRLHADCVVELCLNSVRAEYTRLEELTICVEERDCVRQDWRQRDLEPSTGRVKPRG